MPRFVSLLRARFTYYAVLATAALGAASSPRFTPADEVRIATWNVREGFTPQTLQARANDLQAYAAKVRPDILVIEEVTSRAAAEAVRDAMGLAGYDVACSNFNPSDPPDYGGFEVAILSRFPIGQVVEYDPSPDNTFDGRDPPELPIEPLVKLGMPRPSEAELLRGFLWVRIPALRLTVVGVHLKSSRGTNGPDDVANAAKREFVTAAVAESVAQDLRLFPDHSCLVAGDFNVGHADVKNGRDLTRDDLETTSTSDGYDETHALLRDGLVGIRMRNLCEAIRETTFPGINSTPIDNLYVAGAEADRFAPAVLETETYGSDHRSVHSVWTTTPQAAGAAPPSIAAIASPPAPPTAPSVTTTVVGPADAAKHLNGRCTIEFDVRAANIQPSNPPIGFLNSEADFRSPTNFTVVVFDEGLQKFRATGVADFAAHFQGKRIRVTGQVTERRERLQIVVAEPAQIEIVP